MALPLGLLSAAGLGIPAATHGSSGPAQVVEHGSPIPAVMGDSLRVMTLNLAHGRSDGVNQVLQRKARIREQVAAASAVVRREKIDVLAVQEADRPSWWSGSFDHIAAIAKAAGLSAETHTANVRGLGLRYGTGLMARFRLTEARGHTFAPSPPTFSKGFTIARLHWPAVAGGRLDVVSVHLDFASADVRRDQLAELAEAIEARGAPVVVMGDFNAGFVDADGALKAFAERLGLTTYQPEATEPPTFPALGDRIDWILASRGLAVTDYRVLDDVVSDHQPVAATIKVVPGRQPAP